ncbi:hypothetical protein Rhom172_1159 [Rhodothermus marinus SG0.5JP17-172]|nr:hypothetical protein Rhom172_1159 [Rhodothermus marinus SG0.5JP17-172]
MANPKVKRNLLSELDLLIRGHQYISLGQVSVFS